MPSGSIAALRIAWLNLPSEIDQRRLATLVDVSEVRLDEHGAPGVVQRRERAPGPTAAIPGRGRRTGPRPWIRHRPTA